MDDIEAGCPGSTDLRRPKMDYVVEDKLGKRQSKRSKPGQSFGRTKDVVVFIEDFLHQK